MFNLELSIAEWRRRMLAAGVRTPVPLEELESHLREEIGEGMKTGLEAHCAFANAEQGIGPASVLIGEFKKNERTFMKKTVLVLSGIFAVLFGTAFIMPAVAWSLEHGISLGQLGLLLLGILIAGTGLAATIYGFKQRKA